MSGFEFFALPEGIQGEADWAEFVGQVDDAHAPGGEDVSGLRVCKKWSVRANGEEIPVLATPVTLDGPHCFCLLRFTAEAEEIAVTVCRPGAKQIKACSIELGEQTQQGESYSLCLNEACAITFEADGTQEMPLTLFLSPAEEKLNDSEHLRRFKRGIHRVSLIEMQSYSSLYLENGAILVPSLPEKDEQPILEKDWAGVPEYRDFISADAKKKLRICGMGIIDTTSLPWHARRSIYLNDCEDVEINGITLVGAAHWTLVVNHCSSVKISDVKLFGHRENSDGIDLVNCEDVHVSRCYVRTGDDAICLKGMLPPEVMGGRNVQVHHNTIWTEKARSLGIIGETRGDFENIAFCDNLILHGKAKWTRELGSLCIVLSDGGSVRNVLFRDNAILQEDSWVLNCMIRPDFWSTDQRPGRIENVRLQNIRVPGEARINLQGFDEAHKVSFVDIELHALGEALNLKLEKNAFVQACMLRI